ncbi:homocitrate synthase [Apiospora phragmitis]|uniref:Homocitrate synthase n=1 Tax=Apiospora phragmitis TaxID=2905665 RepID=A0ABR1WVK0_9PEZI
MPLHLLGKKSWNVYNTANIARVRADEEAARVREEAEEQKQQEQDAERRLAILRGEEPPPLPPPSESVPDPSSAPGRRRRDDDEPWHLGGGERRKRKRAGEDDTDFEMRLVRSRIEGGTAAERSEEQPASTSLVVTHKSSDAPLTDAAGHIDLFAPDPRQLKEEEKKKKQQQHKEKNPEAEAEAARKQRSFEDQYTMRFSNAAGFRTELSKTASGPWYASAGGAGTTNDKQEPVGKDVWGNEDQRRHEREAARIVSSDPLAAMKRGAAQVRQVEHERRAANAERDKESRQLRREEEERRRREKKRRHHRRHREDGGEDEADLQTARTESRQHSDPRRRHRHRDADSERSRDRHSRRDDRDTERSSSRRYRHESGEDGERRRHKASHHDEKRQRRSDDERSEKRQHRELRR